MKDKTYEQLELFDVPNSKFDDYFQREIDFYERRIAVLSCLFISEEKPRFKVDSTDTYVSVIEQSKDQIYEAVRLKYLMEN